jgi:hypothetical protein
MDAGKELSYELFPDAPVQLIGVDAATNNLVVTPEARAALAALGPGKLCVVGVTGMYRTGKSTLLNFLRHSRTTDVGGDPSGGAGGGSESSTPRKGRGFLVSHTVERGTRGIWMWGRPHKAILENGEECWVLDLDSEGIGGIDSDETHDARIFSLATLLCSTVIYNSLGTIDANAIAALSFVTQLAKHIQVNPPFPGEAAADDDGLDEDDDEHAELEFSRFFPSFLWVLRDFQLDLEDGAGNPITADEYLEQSLRAQPGFDASTIEQNRIRQMMTSYFSSRSCATLVRPLMDEQRLQDIHHVSFDDLREEFRDGLESLRNRVYLHHLRPKVVNNVAVTGKSFLALCDHYVEAITDGGVPTINSAWQDVMRDECRDAVAAAASHYDNAAAATQSAYAMRAAAPVESLALVDRHLSLAKESIDVYLNRAGGPELLAHRETLERLLRERFHALSKENYDKSEAMCREALHYLHSTLIAPKLAKPEASEACGTGLLGLEECLPNNKPNPIKANAYIKKDMPFQALQEDIRELIVHYSTAAPKATGPAKEAVLADFLAKEIMEASSWVVGQEGEKHLADISKLSGLIDESRSKEVFNASRREAEERSVEASQVQVLKMRAEKLQLISQLAFVEDLLKLREADLKGAQAEIAELKTQIDGHKEALATGRSTIQVEAPPPFDSRTDMRALCDGALRMFFLLSGLVWASFMLYSHLFNNIELSQDGPPHGRKGGDDEAPAGLLGPAWLRLAFEMTGLPVNESSFDLHTVENWSLEKDAALPWSRFANAFSFGFIPIASNASSEASTALEVSVPQPTFAFTLGRAIFFCTAISVVAISSMYGVMDLPAFNLGLATCMNIIFYARVWWYPHLRHHILVLVCAPSIPYLAAPCIVGLRKSYRRIFETGGTQEERRSVSEIIGNSWENVSPRKWRRVWKARAEERLRAKGMGDLARKLPMSPEATKKAN